MTGNQWIDKIQASLYQTYPDGREARSIGEIYLLDVVNCPRESWDTEISLDQEKLESDVKKLQEYYPIQYVSNKAWFYGYPFYVDERVLIPRPETEELVYQILQSVSTDKLSILDIGTGSGCIPITLKKKMPEASLSATDKSLDALDVAKKNSSEMDAEVKWINDDVLDTQLPKDTKFDIIVSNPPYIPASEKKYMDDSVMSYEPVQALYVPENDPFVFYRQILELGGEILRPNGQIWVEINSLRSEEMKELTRQYDFSDFKIHKDMAGLPRILQVDV